MGVTEWKEIWWYWGYFIFHIAFQTLSHVLSHLLLLTTLQGIKGSYSCYPIQTRKLRNRKPKGFGLRRVPGAVMSGLQPLPGTSVWGQVLFSKTRDIVECLTSCTGMKGHMQRESYRLSLNCGISKIYQENDRIQTLGILLGKKKKKPMLLCCRRALFKVYPIFQQLEHRKFSRSICLAAFFKWVTR